MDSISCEGDDYFRVSGKLQNDSSEQFIKKTANWRVNLFDLINVNRYKTDKFQGLMSPVVTLGPRLDLRCRIFIKNWKPQVFLIYVTFEFLLDLNPEDVDHTLSILNCNGVGGSSGSSVSHKLNRLGSLDNSKTYDKCMYFIEQTKIVKNLIFASIEEPAHVIFCLEMSIKLRQTCCYKIFKDYEIMLYDSKIYDLEVIVDRKSRFKTHKAILASRSPVFSAMFTSDFKEVRTNLLEINDVTPEAFDVFLHFLYTDEVKNDSEVFQNKILEILYLAEKYAIDALKNICQLHLIPEISIENVIEMFLLADRYNATMLRDSCIKSIRRLYERSYKSFVSKCKSRLGEKIFNGILKESFTSSSVYFENKEHELIYEVINLTNEQPD